MIIKLNEYINYEDYIKHQMEKTLNKNIKQDHINKWDERVKCFEKEFKDLKLDKKSKCLCVASRYGEEVVALQNLGCDAIGIDLVENKPYSIKMDMHDIKFKDNSFDFVYTNAIDHALHIDIVIKELIRVLKNNGILMIKLEINDIKSYEDFVKTYNVYMFNSELDIENLINHNLDRYKLERKLIEGEEDHLWNVLIYRKITKEKKL